MANNLPGRFQHDIPTPTLILMGCRAWDNVDRDPCPVCKGGIRKGHDGTHCARCDSSSPAIEARIVASRVGLRASENAANGDRSAREDLDRIQKTVPTLTEIERRRIWAGYGRGGIDSRNPGVVNRARVGREWLTAIGQEPDWDLVLDHRGREIGRKSEGFLDGNAES